MVPSSLTEKYIESRGSHWLQTAGLHSSMQQLLSSRSPSRSRKENEWEWTSLGSSLALPLGMQCLGLKDAVVCPSDAALLHGKRMLHSPGSAASSGVASLNLRLKGVCWADVVLR